MQNKTFLTEPLRGIVPPLITPLSRIDALDVAGLERLVEHILAGGVAGFVCLVKNSGKFRKHYCLT
jgi:dihydrodipicolinate synthase/N-acetylneuraminate lyase